MNQENLMPYQQLPELQKEIRRALLRNPYPDIALAVVANLVLGFAMTQTTGLNNPEQYLIVEDPDICNIELIHMPPFNITAIDKETTLTPYLHTLASHVKSWLDDPKQKVIAGSVRLHWLLQPTSNINGLLYCMMKGAL